MFPQFIFDILYTHIYNWYIFCRRSTRPDIVAVEAIDPDSSGCSERALITAKSKHEEEQNSVVFAENFGKYSILEI